MSRHGNSHSFYHGGFTHLFTTSSFPIEQVGLHPMALWFAPENDSGLSLRPRCSPDNPLPFHLFGRMMREMISTHLLFDWKMVCTGWRNMLRSDWTGYQSCDIYLSSLTLGMKMGHILELAVLSSQASPELPLLSWPTTGTFVLHEPQLTWEEVGWYWCVCGVFRDIVWWSLVVMPGSWYAWWLRTSVVDGGIGGFWYLGHADKSASQCSLLPFRPVDEPGVMTWCIIISQLYMLYINGISEIILKLKLYITIPSFHCELLFPPFCCWRGVGCPCIQVSTVIPWLGPGWAYQYWKPVIGVRLKPGLWDSDRMAWWCLNNLEASLNHATIYHEHKNLLSS